MKNIYLIESRSDNNTSTYKIGITKRNPKIRLKELQTGNSNELILIHTYQTREDYLMESTLHNFFNFNKIKGEWYNMEQETIDSFHKTCQLIEKNLSSLKQNTYWENKKVKRF